MNTPWYEIKNARLRSSHPRKEKNYESYDEFTSIGEIYPVTNEILRLNSKFNIYNRKLCINTATFIEKEVSIKTAEKKKIYIRPYLQKKNRVPSNVEL
jgi:hypothetical protein